MAKFSPKSATITVMLLAAIAVFLVGSFRGWWGVHEGSHLPSPTMSVTENPTVSPSGSPVFVARPVTVGDYVPDADPLTADTLESAGSGWVVAIDDTTQIDTSVDPHAITPGDRILYLISPIGDRYELANLNTLGLDAPDLVAWDDARDLLLIEQDRTTLNVFDMTTGEVSSSWVFCPGGAGKAFYGEARDGNWLVRGGCEGASVDGLYSDVGALVPSGIVGGPFLTVFDVGDIQVTWEFEGMVDQKFVAVQPDGTSQPLPWTLAGDDCYPLAKGRDATVAMYCYSGGHMSIWELPVDGNAPIEVVTSAQLEDFAAAEGGYGPDEFWVSDYGTDSALRVVEFSLGIGEPKPRLGVLYGGTIEAVGAEVSNPFRTCHAVSGTSALVSGGGGLWWVDFDAGSDPVVMIPPTGSGSPIQTVGTDGYAIGLVGYTALRLP